MVKTPDLADERNPWDTDQNFEDRGKLRKIDVRKFTQDSLSDTKESLEMFWIDPERFGIILHDFLKSYL